MHITQYDVERVIEVARDAATLVRSMQAAGLSQVRNKSSEGDIVTEADVASEQLIRRALAKDYSSVGLWGEESNQMPDVEYFWLVDPIDGTTNFANAIDYNAVTIALQHGATTLMGVTYYVHTGRVYYARPGEGAFQREAGGREVRLQVNGVDRLAAAVMTTGFPYHSGLSGDNNGAEFVYFLQRCAGLRVMGAAALDLALVATGSFAAFWEGWLSPWDAAAGVLMVREAGGKVTDYTGEAWTIHHSGLVASNGRPALHAALLDGIGAARTSLSQSPQRVPAAPQK
jgi:myo-inositol-1(or 4)-monophosphatase